MATKKKRIAGRRTQTAAKDCATFPIVAVGASAGGFEAFGEMLNALPADTGMAFVLIQHLDPKHNSMLAPLLGRKASIPVTQVTQGMTVRPNRIYVIPPNSRMAVKNGSLRLLARAGAGEKNLPVDYFFESLATACKEKAIGVVLSGTASDGTFGLRAIKAEGGICFAQDPKTAKYPGMPASAIASGCVDFVLPPRKIAAELARIARGSGASSALYAVTPPALPDGSDGEVRKILALLRNASGTDFSGYKSSTIHRRIARRMLLKKIEAAPEYADLLKRDGGELDSLYRDILIHVTSFFREAETFRSLKSQILPKIMAEQPASLRIWVPGCSSGEEAYSIAIVVAEYLGEQLGKIPVRIFATDLSEQAIDAARAGIYSGTTLAGVQSERLSRFFVKSNGGYQVTQSIRDLCTFARQNLTQDPPFSRIDLISCRNLLIYLNPALQKRILSTFHFALNNKGYLLLGKSESLASSPDLFTLADKKGNFYRKKGATKTAQFQSDIEPERASESFKPVKIPMVASDLQREADRIVWNRYSHAGVIVDENLQILNFRGDMSPYTAPAAGAASLNLLKMVSGDLVVDVRAAFNKAKKRNAPASSAGTQVTSGDSTREIKVDVLPLTSLDSTDHHFLILFNETRPAVSEAPARAPKADVTQLMRLKEELSATREYLQAIIEEQETTNEELKAANEEALSNNEELQSTNEELETAKEELQSTNEELITLSEQQSSRNTELTQLNDDLRNVLEGIRIPILMLGNDRRVRRFTPSAEKLFNLLPSDVGRPVQDLRPNLDLPDLQSLISLTLDTLSVQEQKVQDREGRHFHLSVRPYRTADNKIDGVLIVLADTDALTRSLEEARGARDFASAIVETVRQPLVVLDSNLRVSSANSAFYATFDLKPQGVEGREIFELAGEAWNIPELRDLLEHVLPENSQFNDFKLSRTFPKIGARTLLLNARRLRYRGEMILLTMEDLTEREAITAALQASRERARELTAGLLDAQEEERRRISRELHDDLNQRLAMITVQLESMERKPLPSDSSFRTDLASIRSRAVDISDDLRRTAHRLHPSTVELLGLPASLRALCGDFSKQEKIRVDYHQKNLDGAIPSDVALCVYRVAQEALRNVVKHSGAKRASVRLVATDQCIRLSISDRGIGYNQDQAVKKGLGIVSMEERVRLVSGEISIRSKPGQGTRITVQIPMEGKPS